MLSLTEKDVFRMHSLDIKEDESSAEEPGVSRPQPSSSQIEAVRQLLQEQRGAFL